jgi:hypothetical protein
MQSAVTPLGFVVLFAAAASAMLAVALVMLARRSHRKEKH